MWLQELISKDWINLTCISIEHNDNEILVSMSCCNIVIYDYFLQTYHTIAKLDFFRPNILNNLIFFDLTLINSKLYTKHYKIHLIIVFLQIEIPDVMKNTTTLAIHFNISMIIKIRFHNTFLNIVHK
jgi:hypothetical protein